LPAWRVNSSSRPHQFGAKHAAARRVDPHHQGLDVVVLARAADLFGHQAAAHHARRRVVVEDLAFGDDDADLRAAAGQREREIRLIGHLAEGAL
jgi:hypothetical protein